MHNSGWTSFSKERGAFSQTLNWDTKAGCLTPLVRLMWTVHCCSTDHPWNFSPSLFPTFIHLAQFFCITPTDFLVPPNTFHVILLFVSFSTLTHALVSVYFLHLCTTFSILITISKYSTYKVYTRLCALCCCSPKNYIFYSSHYYFMVCFFNAWLDNLGLFMPLHWW